MTGSRKVEYNELLVTARSMKFTTSVASILYHRGQIYLMQKNYARAAQDLTEAIELTESIRIGLQAGQEQHIGFQKKWVSPHHLGIQAFLGNLQKVKAYDTLELAKSRSFINLLADTPLHNPKPFEDYCLIEKEETLRQKIRGQVRAFDLPQDSPSGIERQMEVLRSYQEELSDLYSIMAQTAPDYVAIRQGRSLSFAEVKSCLQIT
jgi:predicted nucleic acid-binding protein